MSGSVLIEWSLPECHWPGHAFESRATHRRLAGSPADSGSPQEEQDMQIRTLSNAVFLTSLSLSLFACAATRKSALDGAAKATGTTDAGTAADLMKQAEGAWTGRGERAKLEAAIDLWKKAAAADPANHEAHVRLSRAYYFLADGHMRFDIEDEDERKEKMGEMFGEGQFHGEKALLILSPEFRKAREAEVDVEDSMAKLPKEAVPGVYWWATNLGKWANAQGFITLLANKDKVFAMMEFCVKHNEDYFYGAPHRYFGAFYTKIPLPGGDKEKSKKHFEIAVQKGPNYLATRVLMASYHAIKYQDRAMYDSSLKYVMDADVNVIPELSPEHAVEKKKAAALIAEADDHFE
jgi:tetratricopeptide (TPR) repeat protein